MTKNRIVISFLVILTLMVCVIAGGAGEAEFRPLSDKELIVSEDYLKIVFGNDLKRLGHPEPQVEQGVIQYGNNPTRDPIWAIINCKDFMVTIEIKPKKIKP